MCKALFSAGAFALLLGICLGIPSAAKAADTIAVNANTGAVTTDPAYDGPQVKKIRLLREGNYLEIYWDRYVDEDAAVDPQNFVLKANGNEVKLTGNTVATTGSTDTIFFDHENKAVAATAAHCMDRLDPDLHMSSISFNKAGANILKAAGYDNITLEIKGSSIKDNDGKAAKDAIYTDIPRVSFYSKFRTTKSGIIIKSDDTVKWSSLDNAAEQVDHELGKEDTGIAETMRKWNCSLAVYSPRENVYLIPEHRGGFSYDMYDVEGYGGSKYNNCVSSIAERNITRTRNNSNDFLNTKYPNENILIQPIWSLRQTDRHRRTG